jgi:nucleoside phosphorylase
MNASVFVETNYFFVFCTFEGSVVVVVVVVVVVGSIAATTAAFSSFPVPSWVSAMTASSLKKKIMSHS